jgi:hypothetical protein
MLDDTENGDTFVGSLRAPAMPHTGQWFPCYIVASACEGILAKRYAPVEHPLYLPRVNTISFAAGADPVGMMFLSVEDVEIMGESLRHAVHLGRMPASFSPAFH